MGDSRTHLKCWQETAFGSTHACVNYPQWLQHTVCEDDIFETEETGLDNLSSLLLVMANPSRAYRRVWGRFNVRGKKGVTCGIAMDVRERITLTAKVLEHGD